jgi:outer membrane immunogenic protein
MKKLIALTAVAALAAPAAFAGSAAAPMAEPPVVAPAPMAPSVDWTGPYLGVTAGVARTTWNGGRSTDGAAAVHAGYNYDLGDWVAGGELSIAPGFNQEIANREIRWGAAARLRAGPKFGPAGNTWGFGSLGLTHVEHKPVGGGASRSSNGWLVGVGASHLLQDNVILTGELSHGRFGGNTDVRSTGVTVGVSFRF